MAVALRAMGVGPGDDVVVPSSAFYASAEAIPPTGARPLEDAAQAAVSLDADGRQERRDRRAWARIARMARQTRPGRRTLPAP